MSARTRWIAAAAITCGVMTATAPGARAQSATPAALENLATAVLQDRNDLIAAARSYREAASYADVEDARAVEDLQKAGALFAAAGKLGAAQATMENAGKRALAAGLLGNAADAFADAALIAAKSGNSRGAAVLAHRASWWAKMDGVSDAQRASILARLNPTMVALANR